MSKNILIVDDEPDMCWIISQLVQSQGFNVVTAYTGEDACLKLAKGRFSTVFLDAKLPDMDGFDVVKEVKLSIESKQLGSKQILQYKEKQLNVIGAIAIGYIQSPYEDRIVILTKYERVGYEGPPNVIYFKINGNFI